MSDIVIRVEELGKLYRLGEIGTGTISHDLNRWWARVRGKDDPFTKVGEANDRTQKGSSEYVWALKDVNFEVKQGEVLGIIGRNGAGKSTLLKILSKVTTPSQGRMKVKGRIASLLEVGTGFHPELTGRENIFLNGAILGMTKAEIRAKFDEIVDFAGVERYIDTPVKRYSSGMYVRLAFAVAAFLEPEILIVDEVLAVGDAEFQKKCLGRMKDVSTNEGRTVLFVSHNLSLIQKLCNKGLLLRNGTVSYMGEINGCVKEYLSDNKQNAKVLLKNNPFAKACLVGVEILNKEKCSVAELSIGETFTLKVDFQINEEVSSFICAAGIVNQHDVAINTSWQTPRTFKPGIYTATFTQNELIFAAGKYKLNIGLSEHRQTIKYYDSIISFDVIPLLEIEDDSIVSFESNSGIILNPMRMEVFENKF